MRVHLFIEKEDLRAIDYVLTYEADHAIEFYTVPDSLLNPIQISVTFDELETLNRLYITD